MEGRKEAELSTATCSTEIQPPMDRLSSPPGSPHFLPLPLSDLATFSPELANLSHSSGDLSPKSAASSLESVSSDLESAVSASESTFPPDLSPPTPLRPSLEEEDLDFHEASCTRPDSVPPCSFNDDHLPRLQVSQVQSLQDSSVLHHELKECSDLPSQQDGEQEEEEGQPQQRSLSRTSSLNAKAPEFVPKNVSASPLSSPAPPPMPSPPIHVQAPSPLMRPLGSPSGGLPMFPSSPTIPGTSAFPLGTTLPAPVVGPPPPPIQGCIMGPMPMLGPSGPGLLNMQLHGPPPSSAILPPAFTWPSPSMGVPGQPQTSRIPDNHVNQTVGANAESVQPWDQPQDLDSVSAAAAVSKPVLTDELKMKIVKQVEYYFSDVNLPTDNYLMKFVRKDPEGFVPIPVVASFRKIKNLVKSHALVASALRSSNKLVVSDDGKKVRRLHLLPEVDLEEVQSRTVVAENLPEDHSIPSMEKLFGKVGNVKMVQICQPEAVNSANQTSAKFIMTDMVVSNKLHALIEFESVEQAERAVTELTDHRNWRSGLHVRPLLRRTFQSKHSHQQGIGSRGRKLSDGGDGSGGEEHAISSLGDSNSEKIGEESLDGVERFDGLAGNDNAYHEKDGGSKRGRGRGRGRSRGRGQFNQNGARSHPVGTPPLTSSFSIPETKPPPGPRMPDGTRGFTLGRGKFVS